MSKEIETKSPVEQPRLVVLLHCPFCDDATAKPYVALYDEDAPNRRPWGFVVRCPHCEAQGPRFGTCEDAEEAWNTRPKPKRQLLCGWRGMAGGDGCIRPLGHEGGHGFSDGSGFQHNDERTHGARKENL
jgi:hypothetical protein